MSTLSAFLFTSVDGFYKDEHGSIEWHEHTGDGNALSIENLSKGHTLLFGRKTYELMYSFWPTHAAVELYPEVAQSINEANKIVVSSHNISPKWQNTHLLSSNWLEEIQKLKKSTDITVLGSGSLVNQLVEAGLLDHLKLLIDPVALGKGTGIFDGITRHVALHLQCSRVFSNGAILAHYKFN